MEKILVIEDDEWISKSLKLYLENSNFIVELCNNWNKAIKKIKEVNPDLIILDINLPWKDWMYICKEVRNFSKVAIIMLTARDSEFDRISWLEIWADDYIAKPFSPRELLVRIKTILKRTIEPKNENILTYKNIKLDIEKEIIFVWWKQVALTKNEYDLIKKILQEDWKVLSREVLMTEVLGYDKYIYMIGL
jgi:DNA-binding response OmpR family regulator